jgi:hypothetical protein
VAGEDSENRTANCALCADSNLTLKEQMKKLDDMKLLGNKKATRDKTSYHK